MRKVSEVKITGTLITCKNGPLNIDVFNMINTNRGVSGRLDIMLDASLQELGVNEVTIEVTLRVPSETIR